MVRGHAGRAEGPEGNLVCAAVSMLVQSFGQHIKDCADRVKNISVVLQDGEATIKWNWIDHEVPEVIGAFEMAETGFRMLEESYPDRILVL